MASPDRAIANALRLAAGRGQRSMEDVDPASVLDAVRRYGPDAAAAVFGVEAVLSVVGQQASEGYAEGGFVPVGVEPFDYVAPETDSALRARMAREHEAALIEDYQARQPSATSADPISPMEPFAQVTMTADEALADEAWRNQLKRFRETSDTVSHETNPGSEFNRTIDVYRPREHSHLAPMTTNAYDTTGNMLASATDRIVGGVGKLASPKGMYDLAATLPAAVVQSLADAATLPGDAYTGSDPNLFDPDNPIRMTRHGGERMGNLVASLPMGVGAARAAGVQLVDDNTVGMFGGRLAKTADHQALAKAEQMEAQGVDRGTIWKDTGWGRGVDGEWRFEIDDSGAKLKGYLQPGSTAEGMLGELMPHADLYAGYPGAANIEAKYGNANGGVRGRFSPGEMGDEGSMAFSGSTPSVALHEAQHYVQGMERFGEGGNPANFQRSMVPASQIDWSGGLDDLMQRYGAGALVEADARQTLNNLFDAAKRDERPDSLSPIINEMNRIDKMTMSAADQYRRLAGEVEARTVQKRMDLTADERRARPMWEDYDVPERDQIVRRGGDGTAFSNADNKATKAAAVASMLDDDLPFFGRDVDLKHLSDDVDAPAAPSSLDPDGWESAWFDRLTENSQRIDHYGGETDGKTALKVVSRNKSTPKAYVEQEAGRLTNAVRGFESKLVAEGLPPSDIADSIAAHFGFPVSGDDYAKGLVWWRDQAVKSGEKAAVTDAVPETGKSVGFRLTPEDREFIKREGRRGASVFDVADKLAKAKGEYVSVGAVAQVVEPQGVRRARDMSVTQRAYTAPDVAALSAEDAARVLSSRLDREVTPQAVRRGRQRAAEKGAYAQQGAKDYVRWTDDAKAALRSPEYMALTANEVSARLAQDHGIKVSPLGVRVMRSREGLSRRAFEQGNVDKKPPVLYANSGDRRAVEAALANALGRDGLEEGAASGANDLRGRQSVAGGQRGPGGENGQGLDDGPTRGATGSVRERRRVDFDVPGYNAVSLPEPKTPLGETQRSFYVHREGRGPSPEVSDQTAKSVLKGNPDYSAKIQIIERSPGRWEVADVRVRRDERRRGLATALYDAVERDLGIKMQPSGILKPDGYDFWLARDPDAVKYHVRLEGGYVSPKKLLTMKIIYNDIAESSNDLGEIMRAAKENARINELLRKIPPEAMEPEVFDAMFSNKDTKITKAAAVSALADEDRAAFYGREVDPLGYYSAAIEAARGLKQAKGTPEQMLAQLKAGGAKQAELEATGLLRWIEEKSGSRESGSDAGSGAVIEPAVVGPNGDRTSGTSGRAGRLNQITKAEIIDHLEKNRVVVNESEYGVSAARAAIGQKVDAVREKMMREQREVGKRTGVYSEPTSPEYLALVDEFNALRKQQEQFPYKAPRWSSYSLDPSNPTYRETVIHLPPRAPSYEAYADEVRRTGREPTIENYNRRVEQDNWPPQFTQNFQSGHFPEPNIIGHMMTSMTKHEGKPVYTIDQIQSDWGQKLRDGGVRDEKKIAELKAKLTETSAKHQPALDAWRDFAIRARQGDDPMKWMPTLIDGDITGGMRRAENWFAENRNTLSPDDRTAFQKLFMGLEYGRRETSLIAAELHTAEATSPGHPLVNTTDQWTNTTLRRALRQAAEADAGYIAIPSGDTVLSYNPGKEKGMQEFYDKIVPKNLRNIIAKLDKNSPAPTRIDQLETPTSGMKGNGFTLFPLTREVKDAVLKGGQALFSNADSRAGVAGAVASDALDMSHEARMARAMEMGFDTDNVLYHGTPSPTFDEFSPSANGKIGPGVYLSTDSKLANKWAGDGAVMPVYARGKIGTMDDHEPFSDAARGASSVSEWKRQSNDAMRDAGYTGYRVQDEVVLFDPKNIRSVNAAFDPSKSDSANLLAANPGSDLAGILAATPRDDRQAKIDRALRIAGGRYSKIKPSKSDD